MSQGNIKFQVMARMNGILVVTKKPDLLRAAETWIKRLDTSDTNRTGVHVYRVNYGEAKQVAKVLNDIFVGGGSSSSFDTPSSTAPRSATDRLSLGGSSGQSGAGGSGSSSGFGGGAQTSGGSRSGNSAGFQSTIGTANGANANALEARGAGSAGLGGGAGGSNGAPLLEGVRITSDASSNSLLIYASNENYQLILRTLAQLDRPQLQVAIDATVAEVTLNDTLSYGVQFYLQNSKVGLFNTTSTAAPTAGVSATGVASAAGAVLSQSFPGFNFLVGSQNQPNVIINALHSVTDVKVLSNPSLVVTDNQVATLMVGDDVPISTGTANVLTTQNTIVNTIDYRSTGIILRVIPRVSANGNVRLEIEQEISQVSNTGSVTSTTQNLTPTISQRKVKSSISVATGQTVLLAGLIQEQKEVDHSGIPLLDQIPAWGNVVGNTGHNITRTELIIFIRPQIIRDSVDAHYIAEELRSKLKGTLAPVPPYVGPEPRAR